MAATKSDKTPGQGDEVSLDELYPDESRSLENLRHLRLMVLLRDMIDSGSIEKAAETLGVSYRTVSRTIESNDLTKRMVAALEHHLLLGGGSAAAQQKARVKSLEERVCTLEEGCESGLEGLSGVIEKGLAQLRDEQSETVQRLERRLARVEGALGEPERAGEEKPISNSSWRPYRDLVTLDTEPGDEQAYGDATPLIVEWRSVREKFLNAEDGLDRVIAEERMLELEIELVGEHELTLPPRTYPWDGSDRRDEVWRRIKALERARVRRARTELVRWFRSVLTLKRWRD